MTEASKCAAARRRAPAASTWPAIVFGINVRYMQRELTGDQGAPERAPERAPGHPDPLAACPRLPTAHGICSLPDAVGRGQGGET